MLVDFSTIFKAISRLKRKKMRDLSALRQISHAITMQQTVSPVRDKTFSFPARPVSFLKICKSGNWHTSLLSLYTCIYFSTRPRKYSIQLNYTYEYIVGVRKSGKKKKKGGGHERSRRKRNMEDEAPRFEEASRLVLRSFFPPSNVISDSSSWSSIARTWKILYLWQDSAHVIDLSSNRRRENQACDRFLKKLGVYFACIG